MCVSVWLYVCMFTDVVCVCVDVEGTAKAMSIILKPRSRSTSSLKNAEGIW